MMLLARYRKGGIVVGRHSLDVDWHHFAQATQAKFVVAREVREREERKEEERKKGERKTRSIQMRL